MKKHTVYIYVDLNKWCSGGAIIVLACDPF